MITGNVELLSVFIIYFRELFHGIWGGGEEAKFVTGFCNMMAESQHFMHV